MPFLSVKTNVGMNEAETNEFIKDASSLLSKELKKPEKYVMVCVGSSLPMMFDQKQDPLAFIELKSLGLQEKETHHLSQVLCDFIQKHISVPKERIYIDFFSPQGSFWGYNGGTF